MAARTPAGGLMSRISYRMHCRPQSDAASLRSNRSVLLRGKHAMPTGRHCISTVLDTYRPRNTSIHVPTRYNHECFPYVHIIKFW